MEKRELSKIDFKNVFFLSPAQQLRQFGDVGRDLARLVFAGQFGGRSPAGFVVMVDESKLLAAAIDHDRQGTFLFDNLTGAIALVRAGALRALGVTTGERWPVVPDIPTIAETLPGYEANVWDALVTPKGTQPKSWPCSMWPVNAGLADPEILARFTEVGGLPMPMTASELGKLIADENKKWHKLIEFAGISINNRATPGGN
jgi:tripartite-type tricarboxylate transporter receptor subunit TctC